MTDHRIEGVNLGPCPWCTSTNNSVWQQRDAPGWFYGHCGECNQTSPAYPDRDGLVREWGDLAAAAAKYETGKHGGQAA